MLRAALPVSSRTWQGAAHLANYLRGKGSQLVPWCMPERAITSGTTESFRFRVKPRNTAVQRVWAVILRTTGTTAITAELEAPALTGTTVIVPVNASLDLRIPRFYTETLGSKSNTEGEISISVKALGGTVIVEAIACYEQDRPQLNRDSTDLGVDVVTTSTGQPMFDADYASIGGIMDSLAGADARRVGIWHWTVGDSISTTRMSASYDDLLILPVPVLARKLARSAVTGSVKWSVYAKMSSAGTGGVRLTTTGSGVSDVMPVTSTTFAWTTARSISIDCDDMDSIDGRQTSGAPAWDDMNIEIAGDGTRTLTLGSISIWSDD